MSTEITFGCCICRAPGLTGCEPGVTSSAGSVFFKLRGLQPADDAFEAPRFHTINVFPRELESHLIIGRCKFDVLAVSANNDSILIHGLAPPPDARQAQVTRKSVASALTLLCSNIEGRDHRSI